MVDKLAIIIDNGSENIKCGIANDDNPRSIFPAVVGRIKNQDKLEGCETYDKYVGWQAKHLKGVLNLKYPLENGIVIDWEDMTKIWEHAYLCELRILSDEYPVFLTEAIQNPKSNREKMVEVFFEQLNCPSMYIALQAVLPFYFSGRTTGLVIESGDDVTQLYSIFEGFMLDESALRSNLAGRACNRYMATMLNELCVQLATPSELETVRDMKEKLCYVAQDFQQERQKFHSSEEFYKTYELPDGDIINIETQRFRCPEILFRPILGGLQLKGIHELIHKSIKKCHIDVRKHLYNNVILSGGSTLFEGFSDRLTKELQILAPKQAKVKVISDNGRKNAVWIGASILASLNTFNNLLIHKKEYQEVGATIGHKKCK